MGRAVLVIANEAIRHKAMGWLVRAPLNTRVTFQGPKRSLEQNARFWAMLTDIATQKEHHGMRLQPDDWRLLFLNALKQEMRIAPSLDGTAFVNLGASSSNLSKAEFSDLFEIIQAWGSANGVVFSDPTEQVPSTKAESEPNKTLSGVAV